MELTDLCQELKNWFEKDRLVGKYSITNGQLSPSVNLQENQLFRIVGSVFNDGVHMYPAEDLIDEEEFKGAIWPMAVPPAVIALLRDITAWEEKNQAVITSPYASESFGGYSYTLASDASKNGNGRINYTTVFANQLKRWRKI